MEEIIKNKIKELKLEVSKAEGAIMFYKQKGLTETVRFYQKKAYAFEISIGVLEEILEVNAVPSSETQ
jgi:hypothetical protein